MHDAFFDPVRGLARRSLSHRPCPDLSDEHWLVLNLHRVLESSSSGRGFLQEKGPRFDSQPSRSYYFSSLASERRGEVAGDVNALLLAAAEAGDRVATLPDLARDRCFASSTRPIIAAPNDGGSTYASPVMMSTSSSSQPRASISARDMGRNAAGAGAVLGFGFADNLMGTAAV